MPLKIAVVGKTNVGKSTIINTIARKKVTIKHDQPGVTRDRKEVEFTVKKKRFMFIDTAGLEYLGKSSSSRHNRITTDKMELQKEAEMYQSMMKQSFEALKLADCILFVVDGVNGITEEDVYFAKLIREFDKPLMLVVNKCESEKRITIEDAELFKLGLGEPNYISAEHNQGIDVVHLFLMDNYFKHEERLNKEHAEEDEIRAGGDAMVVIAIIGRPNVGKSTLVNAILKEDRVIVGDKAGITRDSISIKTNILNKAIRIIDTAGVRKNVDKNEVEELSVTETMRALRLSQIVLIILDAEQFFVKQDLSIIGDAIREGRAVIIVLNKWDKITNKLKQNEIEYAINNYVVSMFAGIFKPHIVKISALNKTGLDALYRLIFKIHDNWSAKIQTSVLNQWLAEKLSQNPPKRHGIHTVKIKYITQIKIRPPTFAIFANHPDGVSDQYTRFLSNSVSKDFALEGIPIRVKVNKSTGKSFDKEQVFQKTKQASRVSGHNKFSATTSGGKARKVIRNVQKSHKSQ